MLPARLRVRDDRAQHRDRSAVRREFVRREPAGPPLVVGEQVFPRSTDVAELSEDDRARLLRDGPLNRRVAAGGQFRSLHPWSGSSLGPVEEATREVLSAARSARPREDRYPPRLIRILPSVRVEGIRLGLSPPAPVGRSGELLL